MLSASIMEKHLTGGETVALNLVNAEGLCRAMVLDFDGAAHGEAARDWRLIRNLAGDVFLPMELGLPSPSVSVSGRKGFGLWWGLAEPVPVGQVQSFLRLFRRAYLSEVPPEELDLRPDTDRPTKAAQAVAKLPPCLHRGSGKWAGFLPAERLKEEEAPTPWFEERPELETQAAILATAGLVPVTVFLRALDKLQRAYGAGGSGEARKEAPSFLPHLERLPAGAHPPCIRAFLEKGAPHGLQYNTGNLNLAAYAKARGLSAEEGEELAKRMAEASEEHPTSKRGVEAKLRNWRSTREPPAFHCDYPRNTPAWREAFANGFGLPDCQSCGANPGFTRDNASSHEQSSKQEEAPKGSRSRGERSAQTGGGFYLEDPVAVDLIAWAWSTREPLSRIRRAWPVETVEAGEYASEVVSFARLAAEALTAGNPSSAGFFREVDKRISEIHPSYRERLAGPVKAAAEAFFVRFLRAEARFRYDATQEDTGRAALARALHLEQRSALAEGLAEAVAQGPEVGANVVASAARHAAEDALRGDEAGGPLARLRGELFEAFARARPETVETPFPALTGLLHGGWWARRLYVLIAPPKAGKTTVAAECLDYAAAQGHPCLYVGYEMARVQMVEYALARKLRINSRRIETRQLSAGEAQRAAEALEGYLSREGQYLEVWEAGSAIGIPDITAWVERAKAKHPDKTPLVVVDYLQLARTGIREIDAHPSETKRVSEVAVACKDLARRSGAAVLALSSVTKEAERASTESGEIDVTAARDSLAIIHAADGVLTLQTATYREEEGKGENKTERAIDPWSFVARQAETQGDRQRASFLERKLRTFDAAYPQGGDGVGYRARLSLSRHRGSTGDVFLYYRKAWHCMEPVELLPLNQEDGASHGPEETARVFRQYVDTSFVNADSVETPFGNTSFGNTEISGMPSAETAPLTEEGIDMLREPVEQGIFPGFEPPRPIPSAGPEVAFRLVETAEEARQALAEIAAHGGRVGLDLETTGLDPLTAQARLLQVAHDNGPVLVVDLFKAGGLHLFREELMRLRPVAHNATFDAGFMWRAGVKMVPDCTMLAAHVLSGRREKLSALAVTHLGIEMEKELQKADWSGELSEAHLRYAAFDALVTLRLWFVLEAEIAERRSEQAYELMRDAQPAIVQMQLAGMPFDVTAQRELVARLTEERERFRLALAEELKGRNPNSGPQLGEWLTEALGGTGSPLHHAWPKTATGKLGTGAQELKKGLAHLPPEPARVVAELLLPYKVVEKRLSAFGAGMEKHIHPVTGRIHASYHLAGTVTGRMSSSEPNMQQVPREKGFRELFKAPPGRAFVIADYSQMELRVAAIVAGEAALLEAYREGQDTHRLTAAMILAKPAEGVTKAERQLAKAVNFGLLYGQGAKGLQDYAASSYGVEISEKKAGEYRRAWFKAYPAFGQWHTRTASDAKRALAVRTPAGRERRWVSEDRSAPGGFRETEAYNTPVQGGAAEAMLAALGALTRELAAAGLDATPLAVVHDELILEVEEGQAEEARQLVERSMTAGMLAIFPDAATLGLVEAGIARSWAEK